MSRRSLFASMLASALLVLPMVSQARASDAPDDRLVPAAEFAAAGARALLDHAAVLVVGTVASERTEQVGDHIYTLQTVAVQHVLRGTAPSVLTVRVEGGRLADGFWEDFDSFAVPVGGTALIPLHPLGANVGIEPIQDGTYRLNQRLLGTVLQEGALQPAEASADFGLPMGTCDACDELVSQVEVAVANAYATIDDTIYKALTTATLPDVMACGLTPRIDGLGDDSTEVADVACGATGAAATGGYTFHGDPWWSRYLPARYKVWNNTRDVAGEESAVSSGAAAWSGTWWRSSYTGLASAPGQSVVYWTPSDIDALARAGSYSGRGAAGFTMYYGDQYCWSIGAKANCYDIASVARHEMGHVLGLGHSPYKRNVMYFQMPSNTVKHLGPDDVAGLNYLYPPSHFRGVVSGQSTKAVTVLAGTGSQDVTVSFTNLGRTPWNFNRNVVERTDGPFGRCSRFSGSGTSLPKVPGVDGFKPWTSCSQPTYRVANPAGYPTIEPGEQGSVTFRFNAPLTTVPGTTYTENFTLDVAGPLTMANTKHSFTVTVI